MGDWMPAINQDAMRAAMARRQSGNAGSAGPETFAEKSQAAMLAPINRYKTPLGRAATPEMHEAVRRQMLASSGEPS
jgi:hypothetical protein